MSTALILSGGGARAAYQVGVLRTVSEIVDVERINPFPVISGSSAGAINAALLACESHHFGDSVRQLETLWTNLKSESVHGIGTGAVFMSLWRLFRSMLQEGYSAQKTWSLLDNSPLRALLGRAVDFGKLRERLERGDLEALAISALAYRAGISLSFFEARHDVEDWDRHRRVGKSASLTLDHLMASAAIPGIYPAVRIGNEYYGDGAIRQSAPLSPALHLGARKLFVIGVSHNPKEAAPETGVPGAIVRPRWRT
ncbi:MAG: patatin-like phospholipase family protein [Gammaproteobacteria bacterium]|nr:patatin-like phospholipase family protein [Gammaproteobacteria bacterium]